VVDAGLRHADSLQGEPLPSPLGYAQTVPTVLR
jgi:hypothetical protein